METSRLLLLDAVALGNGNPSGVERYARQLLPHLTRALQKEKWLIGWVGHSEQPPVGMPEGAHWYHSPYQRFWGQTALPQLLRALRPALYYTPSSIPPLRASCVTSCTVHDLGVYHQPSSYTLANRLRLGLLSKRAIIQAATVIVPTQYVAGDLQHYWHIDRSKVVVASEGYEKETVKPLPLPVKLPFLLYVGRIESKKNLLPLLQGFVKLADEGGYGLVLAGANGVGANKVRKYIGTLPTETQQRIVLPGYVSEGEKQWLYQNAVAGLVPCPYEGFGLPLLDCFAAGLPVVCAKAGALPEVGAQACLYAEYDSPTDWYLHMRTVVLDQAVRKHLSSAGTERLRAFSWEKTAALIASTLSESATVRL